MNVLRLETQRLILRPLETGDAGHIRKLADDHSIAKTTLNIPHPYRLHDALEWIKTTHAQMQHGTGYHLAITRRDTGELIGAIGLRIEPQHNRAEMGYWIGKPYWNQGYATEAAKGMIEFGFTELHLNRIQASYFTTNPASRRVMEKAGMTYEGTLRQHIIKRGEYIDLGYCSILRCEWRAP